MKRIAMKCTQKEFNIIRSILIDNGFNVSACYCFESFPYLVNDYNGKFYIGTQGPNSIEMKNRIIHEVWNADIFLQYCDIETKFILPTLWKVKDCKEVTDYARNRFSKGMNNTVRPNDFLCVDEDIPTYWFLRENIDSRFNDFTEITLEQFKQYVLKEVEINELPKYFAILHYGNNPLWDNYIVWLNKKYNRDFRGDSINKYYGYDGQDRCTNISNFDNNPTILTLEQWNNIVNGNQIKQTMKQKLTVPASDITKLYNVACVPWMKIIAGYLAEVNSNREITFTQADIDKMFKVATSGQLLVLEEIFGKQQEVIDYNKLKAGSVVMLQPTIRFLNGITTNTVFNFNEPFTIVFYRTPHYIDSSNNYKSASLQYNELITFNQINNGNGKFLVYNALDMYHIVEVISY